MPTGSALNLKKEGFGGSVQKEMPGRRQFANLSQAVDEYPPFVRPPPSSHLRKLLLNLRARHGRHDSYVTITAVSTYKRSRQRKRGARHGQTTCSVGL